MKRSEKIIKKSLYSLAYLFLLGLPAFFLIFYIKETLNLIALIIIILICMIVGGIFDIWAVRQSKKDKFWVWHYNKNSILGLKLFGLPIEDILLFFVLTPVFIITLWESITKLLVEYNNLSINIILFEVILMITCYFIVYKHAKQSKW